MEEIVGRGMPVGTVISSRKVIYHDGKPWIVPIVHQPSDIGAQMTTRYFVIRGLDRSNSYMEDNGIRLHGTNKEGNLGSPDSHGCIRVSNDIAIELADKYLTKGSKIMLISPGGVKGE